MSNNIQTRIKKILMEDDMSENTAVEKAYNHAMENKVRAPKKFEQQIMKDPDWAYYYAKDLLGQRWPAAEPYIMKDAQWAAYYAIDVLKQRWLKAERNIKQYPEWWEEYKKHFNIDK